MSNFKLKIYHLSGSEKGNLDHEEVFQTREEMEKRYNALFQYNLYGLNPTAWQRMGKTWIRLAGF